MIKEGHGLGHSLDYARSNKVQFAFAATGILVIRARFSANQIG
jgi:hypothetical protein